MARPTGCYAVGRGFDDPSDGQTQAVGGRLPEFENEPFALLHAQGRPKAPLRARIGPSMLESDPAKPSRDAYPNMV